MRWIKRVSIACVLLLLIWGVVNYPQTPDAGEPLVTPSKEVTFVTSPLAENGDPDFVAFLNDKRSEGVTVENNMAVPILLAFGPEFEAEEIPDEYFKQLGIDRPPADGDYFVDPGLPKRTPFGFAREATLLERQFDFVMSNPWSEDQFPELAQWLGTNQKALALFREAATRERFYEPLVKSSRDSTILETDQFSRKMRRQLSKAVRVNAMKHLFDGEIDEAFAEAIVLRRHARGIHSAPSIVDWLTSYGIEQHAIEVECLVALSGKVTSAQLKNHLEKIQQLNRFPLPSDAIRTTELCMMLDAMFVTARKSPWSKGWFGDAQTMWEACQHSSGDWETALRVPHPYFDQLAAAFEQKTFQQRDQALGEVSEELRIEHNKVWDPRYVAWAFVAGRRAKGQLCGKRWTTILSPPCSVMNVAHSRVEAAHRLGVIMLALEIFKMENNTYPSTLQELTPDYLQEILLDPFVDKPFIFKPAKTIEDRYQLYSIDMNMQDDDGAPIWDVGAYDGDYFLDIQYETWNEDNAESSDAQ